MYLSRLILNPLTRRVQTELADPYELHRTVLHAFPADPLKKERILYRVDWLPGRDAPALLVQSIVFPDWSFLSEKSFQGFLLALDEPNPAVKEFNLSFTTGQRLAFRLRANPTVKKDSDKNPTNGRRIPIYGEEEQLEWLSRKAVDGGFRLLDARAGRKEVVQGQVPRLDKKLNLRLDGVTFEGILEVIEPEKLNLTVRSGIGSAKGFGFGLLSLARPE